MYGLLSSFAYFQTELRHADLLKLNLLHVY